MVVNMSISNASANAVITCRAYLVNGTVLTRTAYLTVQGQACMYINLTRSDMSTNLTFLFSIHILWRGTVVGTSRAQQHCPNYCQNGFKCAITILSTCVRHVQNCHRPML